MNPFFLDRLLGMMKKKVKPRDYRNAFGAHHSFGRRRRPVASSELILFCVTVAFTLPLSGVRSSAMAEPCVINSPRYRLTSDSVDWSIAIGRNRICYGGVRLNTVIVDKVTLTSAPQFGKVTLLGPGFLYEAAPSFGGRDSFAVTVSGVISRTRGISTIRFVVTAAGAQAPIHALSPASHSEHSEPGSGASTTAPAAVLPKALPPPCPTWDWSKGAPPPMRRPFDRTKLVCPPAPFAPPSQPLGCTCPK
jgi:hypothetical protein